MVFQNFVYRCSGRLSIPRFWKIINPSKQLKLVQFGWYDSQRANENINRAKIFLGVVTTCQFKSNLKETIITTQSLSTIKQNAMHKRKPKTVPGKLEEEQGLEQKCWQAAAEDDMRQAVDIHIEKKNADNYHHKQYQEHLAEFVMQMNSKKKNTTYYQGAFNPETHHLKEKHKIKHRI